MEQTSNYTDAEVRFSPVNCPRWCDNLGMVEDFESCYRVARSRDARFDGWFFIAVTLTGIYCRPICPAMTPKRANVRFYPTATAAQSGGFRAYKRCRPDATPGSPEWNARADFVGRTIRLIADGVVDREGVAGLARRLCYTERHLNRLLVAEFVAGPLALARARWAHTARLLIETTELPISEIAFAAGFTSIREFNDDLREVFAVTPRELRRARGDRSETAPGEVSLRLPYRVPFDASGILNFLGARDVPGVEEFADGDYRRTLRLPCGAGIVTLSDGGGHVRCVLRLEDLRELGAAVQRCRRLLNLDADSVAVAEVLGTDPLLASLVCSSPGLRIPGSIDGTELAVRAVLGQQVSVAGARTLAGRLVARCGQPLPGSLAGPDEGLTYLFPEPASIAEAGPAALEMPAARREALRELARALDKGELFLDPGADREEVGSRLLSLRGIGPWTASYVAMRTLGDPHVFLPTDLGVRRAISRLGQASGEPSVAALAERWRPWLRLLYPAFVGESRPWVGDEASKQERGGNVKAYLETVESPAGPLAFAVNERGALVVLKFVEGEYERTIEQDLEREGFEIEWDRNRTARVCEELLEYLTGERRIFDLPLAFFGSEWQQAVWRALTRIPFGETRSYAEVAEMAGRKGAARAVGRANSTNRLPLVVPCHRVIGANGSLTGFAGGVHLKTRLLNHETRLLAGMDKP